MPKEWSMDFRVPHRTVPPAAGREIVYWFRPTTVPAGGAPLPIRERWVGVPLPVRRPRPVEGPESYRASDVIDPRAERLIDDGVAVDPVDAVATLRFFDEPEAADWWEELARRRPLTWGLVFRRSEGDLMPPSLAKLLHPELVDFELPSGS
jgi:hypothetical protein